MKIILFLLGVVAGLAFARIPHPYLVNRVFTRGDENTWPDQLLGPRYRQWQNGVEL